MSFHDWKYLRFAPELAPAHPPLAYPIYASGMENRSAIAGGIGPLRPAPPIGPVVAKLDPRVGRGAGDDSGSRAVGEVGKSPVHQDAKFVAKTD